MPTPPSGGDSDCEALKRQIHELQAEVAKKNEQIATLKAKLGVATKRVELLRADGIATYDVIRGYHRLGSYSLRKGEPVGTLLGAMGLHPLDLLPEGAKRASFLIKNKPILTYTFGQVVNVRGSEDYLFRLVSDHCAQYNIGPYSDALLDLPGFVGHGYDPNPPSPGFHLTGLSNWLVEWRTEVFEPHLGEQNAALRKALPIWGSRVRTIAALVQRYIDRCIDLRDEMDSEVSTAAGGDDVTPVAGNPSASMTVRDSQALLYPALDDVASAMARL